MTKVIEAVIVGYHANWCKWPDTEDRNYLDILALREDGKYVVNGEEVTMRVRWYPVHRAYTMAGVTELPLQHPFINNTLVPPQSVLDAMVVDLRAMASDGCKILFWEHAYHCYPFVAQRLKGLYAHSVLIHCDDSPGATETKTQPIAKFFDSVFHGNLIWLPNGELTEYLYQHRLGVADTHYIALSTTGGFRCGLSDWIVGGAAQSSDDGIGIAPLRYALGGSEASYLNRTAVGWFNMDRRVKQIRSGAYANDLVFVGGLMNDLRSRLNEQSCTALFHTAGLRTKIYGIGMRDGPLLPRVPVSLGQTTAPLYLDSFSALNVPFIGLVGTRPFDCWASGTLLLQHATTNELAVLGINPGVHYAEFDGSIEDLIRTVRYYQQHLDETEAVIRAGHALGEELSRRYSLQNATEEVLTKFEHKWGW